MQSLPPKRWVGWVAGWGGGKGWILWHKTWTPITIQLVVPGSLADITFSAMTYFPSKMENGRAIILCLCLPSDKRLYSSMVIWRSPNRVLVGATLLFFAAALKGQCYEIFTSCDIDFSNFWSKILKDIINSRYTTSVVTPVVNVIYVWHGGKFVTTINVNLWKSVTTRVELLGAGGRWYIKWPEVKNLVTLSL